MKTPQKGESPYLGLQIRKKREQTGIALTKAAIEMNISPSLLCQIKRGIVSPSISTLRTIADYLNTYIGVLLGESINKENVVIVRKGDKNRSIVWGKGDKLYQHEGEESAYVLEGKLQINLNGNKFILNKGDFIWFQSAIPHQITNLSDKKSLAIWVDTPPRF